MLQEGVRTYQHQVVGGVLVQRFPVHGHFLQAELAPLVLGDGVLQTAGDGHQIAVLDGIGAVLLHIHQPVHEPPDLLAGVLAQIDGVACGEHPLGLLQGVIPGIDGGAGCGRIANGDIGSHGGADGVHQRGGRGAAVVGEFVGIGALLREHDLRRIRVLIVGDLCVECVVGGLRVIFARHHPVTHVLRDGKHLRGGQTHIQVVAGDAVLHIPEGRTGGDVHFLVVGQHGGAGGNMLLSFLAENG